MACPIILPDFRPGKQKVMKWMSISIWKCILVHAFKLMRWLQGDGKALPKPVFSVKAFAGDLSPDKPATFTGRYTTALTF